MLIESILATALRFRMVLLALAVGLLIGGVITLRQMPNDVVPELASGPALEVQTEALGLSSQEVEQYVTVPLENNLLDGVMGVWDVTSHSIPSLSVVDLHFEPGTTVLHARQLVEERLTSAFSLPNVSKPPQLIQPLSTTGRVMMIGLSSKRLSPLELSYLARWVIQPKLAGVAGVSNVAIFGQRDRQIQVLVDPGRLARSHVALSQIIQTAGNAQLVSPLSYLEGAAPGTGGFLDEPNQRLEIRPVLPLGAPRNLATVPIADAPGHVTLGSVSQVVLGNQPLIGDALTRQGSGLVLLVQKLPGASVRGVTDGVERALNDLRPAIRGVNVDTSLYRPATYVSESFSNLELGAILAGALVLLALAATLLDARAVAITGAVVALSLLGAVMVLDLLGYSFNALVVLGLLMALVVVVDDALSGTLAMVARMRTGGAQARGGQALAVLEAMRPLRSTLGYATIIVLLSIAPALVSSGLAATFVHPMLLAFALSVIVAMVLALTLTPALGLLAFGSGPPVARTLRESVALGQLYDWALPKALRIPRPVLMAVGLVGLVAIVALPFLGEPGPPKFQDRNLVVSMNAPTGTSLREMVRISARTQAALSAIPGVTDVGATVGRAVSGDRVAEPSSGQLYVTVSPQADLSRVQAAVDRTLAGIPGVATDVQNPESAVMGGVLTPARKQVTVRVYGEATGQLNGVAAEVKARFARAGGLGAATVQRQLQEPNIEVRLNDAAALRAGVLPGDARRQASTLVSGLTVGNFFQDQAVFDVVVRGAPAVRSTLGDVRNLSIDTAGGGHVRLGDIATVSVAPDPVDIQHEALSRYVDVVAPVRSGSLDSARARVGRALAGIALPLNVHTEVQGGTPEDPTSHVAFLSYVLAAALGIVLLLQAAFSSWRLAAVFFLTLPVSLAGALLIALLTGQLSSLAGDAGLLATLAFSVRQGMPLVASLRRAQLGAGGVLSRDVVQAVTRERGAAAMGSALVISVALLPFIVIGDAAGNELGHVAAAVMLGGVLWATIMNQLVLPGICLTFAARESASLDDTLEQLSSDHALTLTGGGG